MKTIKIILFIAIVSLLPVFPLHSTANAQSETENSASSHIQKGYSLRQAGKLDEAANEYQQALEIEPDNISALLELGLVYSWQHRLNDSILAYRKVIRIDPRNTTAYMELGRVYSWQNMPDDAMGFYKKAAALEPKNPITHINLGQAYSRNNDPEKAKREYLKTIQLDPNNSQAYRLLGEAYFATQQFEDAVNAEKKALELDPKNADIPIRITEMDWDKKHLQTQLSLAWSMLNSGQIKEAGELYRQLLREYPKSLDAQNGYAVSLAWSGKFQESIALFRSALKDHPDNEGLLVGLAQALSWNGQADESISVSRSALKIYPGNRAFLRALANAFYSKGDTAQAIVILKDVLSKNPDDVAALGSLADIYRKSWKIKDAVSLYNRILSLDPENKKAAAAAKQLPFLAPPQAQAGAGLYTQEDNITRLENFVKVSYPLNDALSLSLGHNAFSITEDWGGDTRTSIHAGATSAQLNYSLFQNIYGSISGANNVYYDGGNPHSSQSSGISVNYRFAPASLFNNVFLPRIGASYAHYDILDFIESVSDSITTNTSTVTTDLDFISGLSLSLLSSSFDYSDNNNARLLQGYVTYHFQRKPFEDRIDNPLLLDVVYLRENRSADLDASLYWAPQSYSKNAIIFRGEYGLAHFNVGGSGTLDEESSDPKFSLKESTFYAEYLFSDTSKLNISYFLYGTSTHPVPIAPGSRYTYNDPNFFYKTFQAYFTQRF